MTQQAKQKTAAQAPPLAPPESPNALLTRIQTAAALTQAGFPVRPGTLAALAVCGDGPPYRTWGSRSLTLYRWGDAMAWAVNRLSPPRTMAESYAKRA